MHKFLFLFLITSCCLFTNNCPYTNILIRREMPIWILIIKEESYGES